MRITVYCLVLLTFTTIGPAAADIDGVVEHPLISRYPGQEIRWQEIDNNRPFRIPVGPVTGYRTIGDWIDTTGRVTRTFYALEGERTASEVFRNYQQSLEAEKFDVYGARFDATRGGADIGSRSWLNVYLAQNPLKQPGEAATQAAGTATQGGAGAIVARKQRAAGDVYVVINVEQHAEQYVGTLIDIVEVQATEVGLVAIDPEAIGRDIEDKGRVVLTGIVFEYDRAALKAESEAALAATTSYLEQHQDMCFFVVGHTDGKGTFAYNAKLSADRAQSVVDALSSRGIDARRMSAHGVGPLAPVFSNNSDGGRAHNRRVELVQRLDCDG
jgi:outer membrane protein OmpA-like peptidoglycan-associated protein